MVGLPRGQDHGAGHQLFLTDPIVRLAADHDHLRFLLQVNAVGETILVLSPFGAGHLVKKIHTAQSIRGTIPGHQVLAKALAVAAVCRKVLFQGLIVV